MFEAEFLTMMPDTIIIRPVTSHNLQGLPDAWGVGVAYRCRISGKGLALRHQQGEEGSVIYDCWAHAEDAVITMEDKVVLPSDPRWEAFTDDEPILFTVGRLTDDFGQHHVKLQFGWMYHRQGQ